MKQAHDEVLEKWLDEQVTYRRWLVNPKGDKWQDGYASGILDGTIIVYNKIQELWAAGEKNG